MQQYTLTDLDSKTRFTLDPFRNGLGDDCMMKLNSSINNLLVPQQEHCRSGTGTYREAVANLDAQQSDTVVWPNGKASDYESEDSGFDPQHDHIFAP
jgi:hypothetical protein